MTSATFCSAGTGKSIRFAVGECSLGSILVAATERGICAILSATIPWLWCVTFKANEHGYSQVEVAYQLKLHYSTLSRIVKRAREPARVNGLLPKREFYWGKIQIGRFSTNKLVVRRNSHEKTLRAPNGIGLSEYCPLFL